MPYAIHEHEFLSTADAAKLLGVTPPTVRFYEAEGRLRAVRTAGGWRLFLRSDVEQLIAARAAAQKVNR